VQHLVAVDMAAVDVRARCNGWLHWDTFTYG
jgi:hypothetical protein